MELRQLEHFVAVAEERHFTRAAERVSIVQSGLSASIKALERELGAPLFVRSTRSVMLTPAGHALLPEAQRTLAAARGAQDAVAAVEGLQRGELRLGMSQVSLPAFDIPGLVAVFQREYPTIEVRLLNAAPDAQFAALREGRLDLAFLPLLEPPGPDLEVTPLAQDRLALVIAPDHELVNRGRIQLKQLAHKRFIDLPPDWTTRRLADRAFDAAGVERGLRIEVNDVVSCLELVRIGLGVSFLPESAERYADGVAFRPLARRLIWDFVAVRRSEDAGNPAAREFFSRVLAKAKAKPG